MFLGKTAKKRCLNQKCNNCMLRISDVFSFSQNTLELLSVLSCFFRKVEKFNLHNEIQHFLLPKKGLNFKLGRAQNSFTRTHCICEYFKNTFWKMGKGHMHIAYYRPIIQAHVTVTSGHVTVTSSHVTVTSSHIYLKSLVRQCRVMTRPASVLNVTQNVTHKINALLSHFT